VEHVSGNERGMREDEVRIREDLRIRELDGAPGFARSRLSERQTQIASPAGIERVSPRWQFPDLESSQAIRACGSPFRNRLAAQAQLHAPQRPPFGVQDSAANDGGAFL